MSRAACVASVVLLVAAGLGYHVANSNAHLAKQQAPSGTIKFSAAPLAPRSARSVFTQRSAFIGSATLRRLKLAQTRRVAIEVFAGHQTERLFVAPLTGGGFCYEWASEPGDPGIWADELGGCASGSRPLTDASDDTRVSIVANSARVDRVTVKLSGGRVIQAPLFWVSAPINAGFLLYQPPNNTQVVEVDAFEGQSVVAKDPIKAISGP